MPSPWGAMMGILREGCGKKLSAQNLPELPYGSKETHLDFSQVSPHQLSLGPQWLSQRANGLSSAEAHAVHVEECVATVTKHIAPSASLQLIQQRCRKFH